MLDNSKIKFYKWPEFHYIEFNINISIKAIQAIDSSNSEILKIKETEIQKMIQDDKIYSNLNESDQANYFNQIYEYSMLTIEGLKKTQSYSISQFAFSFLESQLNEICELICKRHKQRIKKDKAKSIIQNYFDFLINEFKINTGTLQTLINKTNEFRTIRNIITHKDGIIVNKDDISLIRDIDGVSINKFGKQNRIELAEGIFVQHLLAHIDKLLKSILNLVDENIKLVNHK